MRTVLFVIDTLQVGGAEKSILEIARRLKVFKPMVITLYSKKPDLSELYRNAGVEVIELNLPHKSKVWWWHASSRLRREINRIKPDIIHAHLFKSEIAARLASKKGEKLIGAFVNDSYAQERYAQQTFFQNFKLDVVKYIDAITAKRVLAFTSITKTIAETNGRSLKISLNKITTIYRGRKIGDFKIAQPSHTEPFVFLTVARLLKRKGYNELIRAFANIVKDNSTAQLWIAGDGHDKDSFKALTAQLGIEDNISFLGSREDIPELLQQAHCFVFASHYEGQGGALVEAMLAGKPIITSDIPVFKEQLVENKTGIFFNVMNETDLSKKMQWMIEHYEEGKQMGMNAREYATQLFDINNVAMSYDNFYSSLIDKNML